MNTNEDGYRSEAYSFDSSGLERAARAARDLEKSKFASEALALSKEQEATKQQENMLKIKEYEVSIEQMKVEVITQIRGIQNPFWLCRNLTSFCSIWSFGLASRIQNF